ncbi:hypothetical protein CSV86_015895 [Pseudomonas putida CSV86]|uniref:Lipoprotein n=2 Tax=Pseudomonas TaxID=286 RepID=A0A177SQD3_PSEPU|nr:MULTISPECIES: hypothetical protein [Pseudomonas]MDG9882757.1 hypothetical protein [Pseudomonas sp. GD04058]NNJ16596.1 hypothetical protein [Pseudomonas bharatica CSV86]OAI93195.1 hypothetical protein AYO28_15450 [Pseudomonas putida]
MNSTVRLTLISLALGLSACTVQQPREPEREPLPPIETAPRPGPVIKPGPGTPKPSVTPTPKPMPRTSASFAPPPGGASHWDPKLGVYVLEGKTNTFYRQRTYYRWNNGWSWATNPEGPWQDTDSSGVPGGLGRAFAQ